MVWVFLFAFAFASPEEITTIPQIGPHYRILTLDKSENPQNILEIYTKMDDKCAFENNEHRDPTLGFYWMMDRQRYKPLNGMIRRGIAHRLDLEKKSSAKSFGIRLNDLKELNSDIENPEVVVTATGADGNCGTRADIMLGPSDNHRVLRLTGLHTDSRKTILPPFRKVTAITLTGEDVATGETIRRTYSAKH